MTRKSINLLNMLKTVVQFYAENPRLLADKPALAAAVEKLKVFIAEIEAHELTQAKDTKTETVLKGETKVTLVKAALKVLAGLTAHAAATNDTALKMKADLTEYDLNRLRDNALILKIHAIYELALPLVAQLGIWDVTPADVDALDTNSAAFAAKDPAIKNIRARSSQATDDINARLDEAYKFTKDSLDGMMLPVKISNPTIYGHYQNARIIINTAGAHKKGTTPDAGAAVK